MDEKICKLFLPLLDKLYNQEPAGEPFRKPVDVVRYGCWDYYDHIKHPIDLSTIRNKLTNRQYKDAWRFIADIQLMFNNAYAFNKRGTPVWEFTNKLSKIWNAELTPIMQRLNYCCATLHKFGPQLLFCHGTTPDKYCQIPIGAKYKCYEDQYSFCMPCFNRIETDYIDIQALSACESTRMKLPTQPVRKSDFVDCTNDHWQYESFIECTQCTRRVHQICDLYPATEGEIEKCIQHDELEHEQRMQCRIPEDAPRGLSSSQSEEERDSSSVSVIREDRESSIVSDSGESGPKVKCLQTIKQDASDGASLDDELLQYAQAVEDLHSNSSAPTSPNPDDNKIRVAVNRENNLKASSQTGNCGADRARNSVDSIAARLTINKMTAHSIAQKEPKFVCNHCYRKKKISLDLRHRKYSARRLPHTRMSRYIETKVNEHIRENSPSAGEVTIRVLTAYRDTIPVKKEMQDYVRKCRENGGPEQHPNSQNYPDEFGYTNRAIFAWQEIDGVDVCVFGMHVQEYGEDCPEPNRQVVYLSYLDSVHFFRPKQVRTAVYHEILLSYFKYVKKLGFRRVFIWVCPSRKGDDYIFYRHPTEQKMPTLKRLLDWYINLLDKGIVAGIVEKHQNIYQYSLSENWTSILSMPYLSGDYWPGEFERLLTTMIESQREYDMKMQCDVREDPDISNILERSKTDYINRNYSPGPQNISLSTNPPPIASLKNPPIGLKSNICHALDGDCSAIMSMNDESKFLEAFTPDSLRSDCEQPLDLSKSSCNTSPESHFDDDRLSVLSSKSNNRKRKIKQNILSGYSRKRGRTASQVFKDALHSKISNSSSGSYRPRISSQLSGDSLKTETILSPEEELMKNLERSLKRQKEGFIVARLNDCDCSPHFESQRRKEEATFTCDLMKGREPFLQLARQKNYEFSTLRRAKFSSLAMVKHLGQIFKLDPICNECYSFDSSKRHYACSNCEDFYLCTSCHENTQHEHIMSLMAPLTEPDIDEFLQQCSVASTTNSISSASSTISNKSFNESNLDLSTTDSSRSKRNISLTSTPLHRNASNAHDSATMPLSCRSQRNRVLFNTLNRTEDEENAHSFSTMAKQPTPPPSHSANNARSTNLQVELDQVLVENFIRHAEISYDYDFDRMKNESRKILAHYWSCPLKETCHRCKFVVLSCSFMSVLMRSTRMQTLVNCNPSENLPNNASNTNHLSGINLTTAHRLSYQPKDK